MTPKALLQILTEFTPIVAFFMAGQLTTFSNSVLVLIVTTVVSMVISWMLERSIPVMPLASAALVVVTGSVTLFFNQPDVIILADTIWFWGLAAGIVFFFFQKKQLLEIMFDKTFAITSAGWRALSIRWLVVLILSGLANEYVRIFMTPEFWIDYRFSKILIIMTFSIYQFTLARRYRIEGKSNSWGLRITN